MKRQLYYLWDNHGHTKAYPCLFETDCELPVEKIQEIAWRGGNGMGRIAMTFNEFAGEMEKQGHEIRLLSIDKPSDKLIDPTLKVIHGITGNY